MKKISVIAVTFNNIDVIPNMINSIKESNMEEDIEIIIIDNASTDGTIDLLKKYKNIKLISKNTNLGTASFNDAINIAEGEYLFIIDPDTEFSKTCFDNLYKTAKQLGKNAVLAPAIYEYIEPHKQMPSYSIISKSFYSNFINTKDMPRNIKEIAMSGFIFIHCDIVKELGYIFDNNYFLYGEDFDLCLRLRLQGYKLYFCPEAVMFNMPPSHTSNKFFKPNKLTYFVERNLLTTFFKICSLKTILLYFPYVIIMRVFAILIDIFRLNFNFAISRIGAYFWILSHFRLILEKRKEIQKLRKIDDKNIFNITDEKYFLKAKLGI